MTKKYKFAIGVVLYNPDQTQLDRVIEYSNTRLFDKVFVYDNSEHSHDCCFSTGELYFRSGKNDGLAIAYNKMVLFAQKSDIDFLCIMDQDTIFPQNEIARMLSYINREIKSEDDIAIISPDWESISRKTDKKRRDILEEQIFNINSGSFLNISCLLRKNLRYDENIFLDGVDYDFCWTARELGCRIMIYRGVFMTHSLGEASKRNPKFESHSSLRYYLIAKNKKYIWSKHKGNVGRLLAWLSNNRLCIKILINEEQPINKIKYCIKGMYEKGK